MHQYPKSLMVFAAGMGTRMGSLATEIPKPLLTVGNKTLLDHALDFAPEAQVENSVVNVHRFPDQIIDHLGERCVRVSDERQQLLETGGGLRKALPLLESDPVFTLNSDAIWSGPNPLSILRSAWRSTDMDALVLVVPVQDAVSHAGSGDFRMATAGQIQRGRDWVYTGAQILKTGLLADIPDDAFSLNVVWDKMIKADRLFGVRYSGKWCDVGTPAGLETAENLLGKKADV